MISIQCYEELTTRLSMLQNWLATSPRVSRNRNGATISYPIDAVPTNYRVTNEERSALEIFEFMRDRPRKYVAYVNLAQARIHTWSGETLGTILHVGRPYPGGFGSTRIALKTVNAINGVTYSGVYYTSSGDYCRLRAKALR